MMMYGEIFFTAATQYNTKAVETSWSPHPKKLQLSLSTGKVMLFAFRDSRRIVLAHFMPKGRTVTAR